MFNKIQKKLLLNYPLLWNIKIAPMGVTIICVNILFFLLGFITHTSSLKNIRYSFSEYNFIYHLIAVLASITLLIIWLVYYLENNGFKSFYPKKGNSLYWEWLLIFMLIFGNCLYSFSYTMGVQAKEKSYLSKNEILSTLKLLNKIEILIPNSHYDYEIREYTPTIDSISGDNYKKDNKSVSLLNFNKYYDDMEDINTVKKWLIEEKQDSIRNLITQYLKLQEKYGLKTNLTVDSWMKLIYNPPTYKVTNLIATYEAFNQEYYLEYGVISYNYKKLYKDYYNYPYKESLLATLYLALMLSILLLSFRTTSGKSWLIGIVIYGLLIFVNGIIAAILGLFSNDNKIFNASVLYWSIIFLIMCLYVGRKIYNKNSFQGRSSIIINLILWMFPYMPIFYYLIFITNFKSSNHTIYRFITNHPTAFFWINLIFVSIAFLFITKLIKKWRAIPKE